MTRIVTSEGWAGKLKSVDALSENGNKLRVYEGTKLFRDDGGEVVVRALHVSGNAPNEVVVEDLGGLHYRLDSLHLTPPPRQIDVWAQCKRFINWTLVGVRLESRGTADYDLVLLFDHATDNVAGSPWRVLTEIKGVKRATDTFTSLCEARESVLASATISKPEGVNLWFGSGLEGESVTVPRWREARDHERDGVGA